jgi:two-component system cell cycle response regulator CpdR
MAHILVVDDDPAMLSFISTALKRAEHNVATHNNGQDALKALKTGEVYDLLLTDIVMPGMDGIELSKEATALFPDLNVMFISGFSVNPTNTQTKVNFKGNLMAKPFHLNDLIARIDVILKE